VESHIDYTNKRLTTQLRKNDFCLTKYNTNEEEEKNVQIIESLYY
jgi:hypothetical protein